jgi:hypothetical protein
VAVLGVMQNNRLLVPKKHQCLVSSVTDSCLEGGSRGRDKVHPVDTALSSTSGILVDNHVYLPLVALFVEWVLLPDVERLGVVVKGAEQ